MIGAGFIILQSFHWEEKMKEDMYVYAVFSVAFTPHGWLMEPERMELCLILSVNVVWTSYIQGKNCIKISKTIYISGNMQLSLTHLTLTHLHMVEAI